MSTTFFKQYIKTKRICFGIKLDKLTSSNRITLNFSVDSKKRLLYNGNENNDISEPERTPFYQLRQAQDQQHSPSVIEYISAELLKDIADTIPEKL